MGAVSGQQSQRIEKTNIEKQRDIIQNVIANSKMKAQTKFDNNEGKLFRLQNVRCRSEVISEREYYQEVNFQPTRSTLMYLFVSIINSFLQWESS